MVGPKRRGGPPPGARVQISQQALVAKLDAMNVAGDHKSVLAFGDRPDLLRTSAALTSAVADAAMGLRQFDRAEALRRQVLAIEPGHTSTVNNLATLLIARDAYDEAEALVRGLLDKNPAAIAPRHNLSLILLKTGRLKESEAEARKVLALKPDHMRARFGLALSLLGQGSYAEGWPEFEARLAPINAGRNSVAPQVSYPAWRGESLAGKSILIWTEQGVGDEIMMARYAAALKARGAYQVSLMCKPVLAPLFTRLDGIDTLYIAQGSQIVPRHDYWTFPMSMPLHVGTTLATVPAPIPYLSPSAAARSAWLELPVPAGTRLKVGLTWKGAPQHVNDHNRSLPGLATLRPLWDIPGLSFFSLQKGQGEDDAATPPPEQPLADLGPRLTDLDMTAAAIEKLDVIVTVDTAVAHIAGALGNPGVVLLPAIAQDWRWLDGRTSPWYPSLSLYRQKVSGNWTATMQDVAADLSSRAALR